MGEGPGVNAAAHKLAIGGGAVFLVKPTVSSTPGVAGAVTHTGTGVSTDTVSGAPYDAFRVIIQIITGAATPSAGGATFKYSLDGGDNYSAEIALPTSGVYLIPGTNLTNTFSAATLVAGDTYSYNCTAPGYNSSELTTAFNALCADPRTWKFVHIVGSASTASGQATLVTAVEALLVAQEAVFRYAYAVMEMPDLGDGTTGDASSITAFASVAAPHVAVAAGFEELTSVLSGRVEKRSAAWPLSAQRHKAPISESSSRVKSGALPGIVSLYRDELIHRGLDAARFSTLRTHINKQGFYMTNGRTMAVTGSDFTYLQHVEIMNVARTIVRVHTLDLIGDSVRVNPLTHATLPGAILEQDARTIEKRIRNALKIELLDNQHVSDIKVTVNRTDNIISTQTLRVSIRLLPKGYMQYVQSDLGFVNPQLELS